ncbi:Smr/MutS family protein [Marinivivus vitaminiproducens]|uniref:Smr/MutS family protein n=1 Tax=Marinivivus vitaminiproducens TaxID=3035935 RepID=UPI0027AB42C2|nr:Smr/MutS family protein [Geminicoccaceae bacterium SCSIO 64248]
MRRPRALTDAERALWRAAMRDVAPLVREAAAKGPPGPPPASPEAADAERRPQALVPGIGAKPKPAAAIRPLTALDPGRPIDIDRRSWLRLKHGRQTIDARLDLHGLTQDQAHLRLERFLAERQRAGARCVLVITGKGGRNGEAVLRAMVPRWLHETGLRGRVITYMPARPEHGGGGALYVLLKRLRHPGAG